MSNSATADLCNSKTCEEQQKLLQIDLSKVKPEPVDDEYISPGGVSAPAQAMPPVSPVLKPERKSQAHMTSLMRFTRTRYIRRNYASPESSVCEVCQAEFAGPDTLRLHKIAHFNTPSVCYVCDSVFIDSNQAIGTKISMHLATNHKALCTPTGTYKPEAERSFVCSICLQRFSSNKILSLHTLKQHKVADCKIVQSCKICNTEHTNMQSLQLHLMSAQHREMKIKIQSLFMCVDCRTIFPARDSYAMHMMMRAQSESCMSLELMASQQQQEEEINADSGDITTRRSLSASSAAADVMRSLSASPAMHAQHDRIAINEVMLSRRETPPLGMQNSPKYNGSGLNCHLCGLRFYHPGTLSMHLKVAHESLSDFVLMQQLMKRQVDLEHAFSVKVRRGTWSCSVCGVSFFSCDALAMHVMERHSIDAQALDAAQALRKDEDNLTSTSAHVSNGSRNHNVLLQNGTGNEINTCDEQQKNAVSETRNPEADPAGEIGLHTETAQQHENSDEPLAKRRRASGSLDDAATMTAAAMNTNSPPLSSTVVKWTNCKTDRFNRAEQCSSTDSQTPPDTCVQGSEQRAERCPSEKHHRQLHTDKRQKNESDITVHPGMNSVSEPVTTKWLTSEIASNNVNENGLSCGQQSTHLHRPRHATDVDKQPVLNGRASSVPPSDDVDKPTSVQLKKDEIIQALVEDAIADKKNRKRNKVSHRKTPPMPRDDFASGYPTPSANDVTTQPPHRPSLHLDTTAAASDDGITTAPELIAIPISPSSSSQLNDALPALELRTTAHDVIADGLDATGHEHLEGQALLNFVVANNVQLIMCKYCHIIYTNRTMYYLHMGLHNLNNPWQCNLCGKECSNVHEFSSHVIHYR